MKQKPRRSSLDLETMRRNADDAARLLKMLAHGQRLRVLCLLVGNEMSVGQINERIDLSQSALSQHLAKMRDEGLVAFRRESQTLWYRIADPRIEQLFATLHKLFCAERKGC